MPHPEAEDQTPLPGATPAGWEPRTRPALPFVLPFLVFILLTEAGRWWPGSGVWIYPLKTVLAAGLLWWYRRAYDELRLHWSWLAVGVGVLVLVLWIALSHPSLLLSAIDPVSPWETAGRWGWSWIAIRWVGSTAVVPVMEELFWRGFVARYLVDPDFGRVPIGPLTPYALVVSSVLFGVEHVQWAAGIMAGLAYAWVMGRTRSLGASVLAHAVTNGLLGVYVLTTGDWRFW